MGLDETNLHVLMASGSPQERIHAETVFKLLSRGKHWVLGKSNAHTSCVFFLCSGFTKGQNTKTKEKTRASTDSSLAGQRCEAAQEIVGVTLPNGAKTRFKRRMDKHRTRTYI